MCAAATRSAQIGETRSCASASGFKADLGQEDAEELFALAFGEKSLEPGQEVWVGLPDTRSGLVQDQPAQVAGKRCGTERHCRAVGVAEKVGGLRKRVHDRGNVGKLLLDRVAVRRVAAVAATAAVDCVEREALGQQRLDEAEAEALDARPMDEDERPAGSTSLVGMRVPSAEVKYSTARTLRRPHTGEVVARSRARVRAARVRPSPGLRIDKFRH